MFRGFDLLGDAGATGLITYMRTDSPRVSPQALEMVRGALQAGAQGMFIGRNVFQAPNPSRMMSVLRGMIHEGLDVDAALSMLA